MSRNTSRSDKTIFDLGGEYVDVPLLRSDTQRPTFMLVYTHPPDDLMLLGHVLHTWDNLECALRVHHADEHSFISLRSHISTPGMPPPQSEVDHLPYERLQVPAAAVRMAWQVSKAIGYKYMVVELVFGPPDTLAMNQTSNWLGDVRTACMRAGAHFVLLDTANPTSLPIPESYDLATANFTQSCWAYFQMCFKPLHPETQVYVIHQWTPACEAYPKMEHLIPWDTVWKPRKIEAIGPGALIGTVGITPLLTLLEGALGGVWEAAQHGFRYRPHHGSRRKLNVRPGEGNPGYNAGDNPRKDLLLRTMSMALAGLPENRAFLLNKTQLAVRAQSIIQGFALRKMDTPTDNSLALCVALGLLAHEQMFKIIEASRSTYEAIHRIIVATTILTPVATPYWFGVVASKPPSETLTAFYGRDRQRREEDRDRAAQFPPALPVPVQSIDEGPIVWYFNLKLDITSDNANNLYLSGRAMTEADTRDFLMEQRPRSSSDAIDDTKGRRLLLVEKRLAGSAHFKRLRTLLITKEGLGGICRARWRQSQWFSHYQDWWEGNQPRFRKARFLMVRPPLEE